MDYLTTIETIIERFNNSGYIDEARRIALLETGQVSARNY